MMADAKPKHRISKIQILTVVSVVLLHASVAWVLMNITFNQPLKIVAESATEIGNSGIQVQLIDGDGSVLQNVGDVQVTDTNTVGVVVGIDVNGNDVVTLEPITKVDAEPLPQLKFESEPVIIPETTVLITAESDTEIKTKQMQEIEDLATNIKIKTEMMKTITQNTEEGGLQPNDVWSETLPALIFDENRKITQRRPKRSTSLSHSELLAGNRLASQDLREYHSQAPQGDNGVAQIGEGQGLEPALVTVEDIDWIDRPLFELPERLKNQGAPIIGYTLTLQLTVNTKGEVVEAVTVASSGNVAIDIAMERIATTGKMQPLTDEQGQPKSEVIILPVKLQT